MAHASLGMAYFREGKVDEARASLERAVAANSQNYLAHYYYAFTLSRQSPSGQQVGDYTPEVSAKIKTHLQQAIKLRPDYLEAYNLLAFVSLVTGDGLTEAIESLKQAVKAAPGRDDFSFTLAQLYARIGDYKTSRQMLEQVAKSANADEYLRQHSATLLKQIQEIEDTAGTFDQLQPRKRSNNGPPALVNAGSDSSSSAATTGTSRPAPAPTPAADPSSYLREVLRSPGAGETQLLGKLLRLECDAKGITFVIETEAGLLRLRTANFEDIEITTYDTSVKGEITCGERKPVNVVVVCYLPNTDKKIKADGLLKSIEFVPNDFKLKP
jgi:Tfp pilus assembly protein PilF